MLLPFHWQAESDRPSGLWAADFRSTSSCWGAHPLLILIAICGEVCTFFLNLGILTLLYSNFRLPFAAREHQSQGGRRHQSKSQCADQCHYATWLQRFFLIAKLELSHNLLLFLSGNQGHYHIVENPWLQGTYLSKSRSFWARYFTNCSYNEESYFPRAQLRYRQPFVRYRDSGPCFLGTASTSHV